MKELTYGDMIAGCYRYLGMNDMDSILDMTPSDYYHLIVGYRLSRLDRIQQELEFEALRNKLNATDKKGKPKYSMKQVFNHDKEVKDVMYETRVRGVSKETVSKFAKSKQHAEDVINGMRFNKD